MGFSQIRRPYGSIEIHPATPHFLVTLQAQVSPQFWAAWWPQQSTADLSRTDFSQFPHTFPSGGRHFLKALSHRSQGEAANL